MKMKIMVNLPGKNDGRGFLELNFFSKNFVLSRKQCKCTKFSYRSDTLNFKSITPKQNERPKYFAVLSSRAALKICLSFL